MQPLSEGMSFNLSGTQELSYEIWKEVCLAAGPWQVCQRMASPAKCCEGQYHNSAVILDLAPNCPKRSCPCLQETRSTWDVINEGLDRDWWKDADMEEVLNYLYHNSKCSVAEAKAWAQ